MKEIKSHPFEIFEVKINRWNLLKRTQTQYGWRVKARNGEIVASSGGETFVNRSDCEYNAKSTCLSIAEEFGALVTW